MELLKGAVRGVTAGFACALALAAQAQAQSVTEPAIKAAFIYKFAGYVQWPAASAAQAAAPLVIATAGADEVAAEIERILPGRTVNGRPVVVRRIRSAEAIQGVHMLFVGRADTNARALLRAGQEAGALTVTESERGLEMGGAVNFVVADDRVGFEVSLDSAAKAGVSIGSRMLAVARRVVPRGST